VGDTGVADTHESPHRVAHDRLAHARVGHLATVTAAGAPHVVPCRFAFLEGTIVSAVDGKPKSTNELRRLANIEANPAVSLVVDHYDDDDWTRLWWVRVDGRARVIDSGPEREPALDALAAKYPQYRELRPPGAVVEITPTTWRSWP
jgi:PPOX class probable F420-dependent enzyme